jgi:hypothetical protein
MVQNVEREVVCFFIFVLVVYGQLDFNAQDVIPVEKHLQETTSNSIFFPFFEFLNFIWSVLYLHFSIMQTFF